MSRVYVIGDTHFGHRNICKYRKFENPDEHNTFIIDQWNKVVRKRDVVYVLGDAAFTEEAIDLFSKMNGQKHLVRGNHDTMPTTSYLRVFREVYGLVKKKGVWLSHAPIHEQELRGRINVHGHVHSATIPDLRYVNVCCENVNYTPVDLADIIKEYGK